MAIPFLECSNNDDKNVIYHGKFGIPFGNNGFNWPFGYLHLSVQISNVLWTKRTRIRMHVCRNAPVYWLT